MCVPASLWHFPMAVCGTGCRYRIWYHFPQTVPHAVPPVVPYRLWYDIRYRLHRGGGYRLWYSRNVVPYAVPQTVTDRMWYRRCVPTVVPPLPAAVAAGTGCSTAFGTGCGTTAGTGCRTVKGTRCMVQAAGTVSGTGCGIYRLWYHVPQPVPERDGPW